MSSQPEEKWLLKAGVLSNYCWFEQVINTYSIVNLFGVQTYMWLGPESFGLISPQTGA